MHHKEGGLFARKPPLFKLSVCDLEAAKLLKKASGRFRSKKVLDHSGDCARWASFIIGFQSVSSTWFYAVLRIAACIRSSVESFNLKVSTETSISARPLNGCATLEALRRRDGRTPSRRRVIDTLKYRFEIQSFNLHYQEPRRHEPAFGRIFDILGANRRNQRRGRPIAKTIISHNQQVDNEPNDEYREFRVRHVTLLDANSALII